MKTAIGMAILALASAGSMVMAQEGTSVSKGTCERKADAADWVPCGPDRVLSEADLATYILGSPSISL